MKSAVAVRASVQSWTVAAEALTTVLLILVAAKAHGRQIRLERERHGVWKVDFRGANDPWVESLWKRDRVVFWVPFPVYMVGGSLVAMLVGFTHVPAWFAFVAAWSFASSFIGAGLLSTWRLRQAMRDGYPSQEWRRAGYRGSVLWWSLVATAAALGVVALLF